MLYRRLLLLQINLFFSIAVKLKLDVNTSHCIHFLFMIECNKFHVGMYRISGRIFQLFFYIRYPAEYHMLNNRISSFMEDTIFINPKFSKKIIFK
jgi:hypothetical protein